MLRKQTGHLSKLILSFLDPSCCDLIAVLLAVWDNVDTKKRERERREREREREREELSLV